MPDSFNLPPSRVGGFSAITNDQRHTFRAEPKWMKNLNSNHMRNENEISTIRAGRALLPDGHFFSPLYSVDSGGLDSKWNGCFCVEKSTPT